MIILLVFTTPYLTRHRSSSRSWHLASQSFRSPSLTLYQTTHPTNNVAMFAHPLDLPVGLTAGAIPIIYVLGLTTGNVSWVDRLWPFHPVICSGCVWWWARENQGYALPRLGCMMGLQVSAKCDRWMEELIGSWGLWGLRSILEYWNDGRWLGTDRRVGERYAGDGDSSRRLRLSTFDAARALVSLRSQRPSQGGSVAL